MRVIRNVYPLETANSGPSAKPRRYEGLIHVDVNNTGISEGLGPLRYPTKQTHAAIALIGAALFTTPAAAQVLFPEGPYIAAEAGGTYHQSVTFSDTSPTALNCDLCTSQFPSSIKNGLFGGLKLGYRMSANFRSDFSVDYFARVQVSGQSTTIPPSTGSANFSSLVALYNVYWDFGPAYFVQPYVTAGMGFARNSLGVTNGNSALGPFTISSNSDTNFAWDAGFGVSFPLSPWLSADLGYRFMQLGELRSGNVVTIAGQSLQLTQSKTGPMYLHAAMIGLRYSLW